MDILETLKLERERVMTERERVTHPFDVQIAEIDAAIKAVVTARDPLADIATSPEKIAESLQEVQRKRDQMPIDDAIIEAVKNGVRSPAKILRFLSTQLGVDTTINSVRTRLSRLKKEGKIAHDNRGWIMPSEVSEGLPLDGNGGAAASPDANTGSAANASGVLNPQPVPSGTQD
ncbi:hypothetical protein [Pseudooceanicola sp.]|uniref:hypothetical protein n=1 Tax=Pseudooceanicola sp. TaxID=1914328 RepID=UPI003511C802